MVLVTLFGDLFYEQPAGEIWWLNSGTGSIKKVSASGAEFRQRLKTDDAELWLLPQLVDRLRVAGKILAAEQCYTLVTPPVFTQGKYEIDNIAIVPAIEHFRLSADLHKQIADLPDGAQVRLKVIE